MGVPPGANGRVRTRRATGTSRARARARAYTFHARTLGDRTLWRGARRARVTRGRARDVTPPIGSPAYVTRGTGDGSHVRRFGYFYLATISFARPPRLTFGFRSLTPSPPTA